MGTAGDLSRSETYNSVMQRLFRSGTWALDPATRAFVQWSEELSRLHRRDPHAGAPAWEAFLAQIHPEDRNRCQEAMEHALREGKGWDLEYRRILPDGEIRCFHSVCQPVPLAGREALEWVGAEMDVSDQKRREEELRERESRFRTFVDHAADGFFLHDNADMGRILDVNRQACDSLGYTREELIGQTAMLFDAGLTPADLGRIAQRVNAGEMFTFETRHRRKDGTDFPVEINIRPFYHGDRHLGLSIARDITDRKRVEEALRENEALLRTFVDHLADAFFLHDTDDFGRILDVNKQTCENLGYSREELIGNYPRVFDVGLSMEEVIRVGERVAAGETFSIETRHRRKDGTDFPVEMRVRPFQHGGKRLSVALARDITERKQAEKALNESHDLLRAVVEGTPDAIFVKDLQGRYRMINSAGARLLGKSVAEVIGKEDFELLPPERAKIVRERDLHILATGEPETFEESVASAAGMRTYLSTKGPYRDRQGNVIGLVRIARDVTELKRLEGDLRQAQKMEAVGRLAGGVAHDFNNLLSVITGYSEFMYNHLRPDDRNRGFLYEVQRAGERAAGLTRQLLAFSRKQVLQPQVIGINPLLSDLGSMLERLIGEGIELTASLDPELGMAKVDPGQFEQAIINLAVNARDAMPAGGRLKIETRNAVLDEAYAERHPDVKPGNYVVVTVSDTGHGMDEATRSRIFEPFFTTKEAGKGTGLGLAMAYGFVKQSGGHIEVESEPKRGTAFKLYLPRTAEAGFFAQPAREDLRIPKGDETILLVEDEEAVRTLTRLVLQSYGYKVLEARDGQDGLEVAQKYPGDIQIVVTDMVMPRMGGRELAGHLVRMRPGMRILFMSGHTDDAILQRGETETGAAFVPKPFSPLALARKVRQLLDAPSR